MSKVRSFKNGRDRLAVIDIGTTTFHMIVVEVNPHSGAFKILRRKKEYVRLGANSSPKNTLTKTALAKALKTLRVFKIIADFHNASVRAVATSAVREASNQKEFLQRAKDQIGIRIEVASGKKEARLVYLGVMRALPVFHKKILLVDIGGGSTEFLIGRRGRVIFARSVKLGAVRLTQRFFKRRRLGPQDVKQCRSFILAALKPVMRSLKKYNYDVVVGSSGTIVAIARMILSNRNGTRGVNKFPLSRREFFPLLEKIISMRWIQRGRILKSVDRERTDIILAGALILEQIFKELDIKMMIVSKYAIREGILVDSIQRRRA